MRTIETDYNPRGRTYEATISVEIAAPRDLIWELLADHENASMLQPQVVRSFQVPGTPRGIGEMTILILMQDGREHVQAYRTIEEVAPEYSVNQRVGGDDGDTRYTLWLTSTSTGTYLQYRFEFTVPAKHKRYAPGYEKHYRQAANSYIQRIKVVAESRWQSSQRPDDNL